MIPLTFHFTFFKTDTFRWSDIHTLTLRSCIRHVRPTQIIVHYSEEDSGAAWEAAKALPLVEWQKYDFLTLWNTTPLSPELASEYARLDLLWKYGGFYADLDVVFLKSFDTFRDTPAVIGCQCKQKQRLGVSVIGSIPGSPFIDAWRQQWQPDKSRVALPWNLSTRHDVRVLNRPAFYPIAVTNRAFWAGGKTCLKNCHAFHLWESSYKAQPAALAGGRPGQGSGSLTVEDLRRTCLASVIEEVLSDQPVGVAHLLAGRVLLFD